MSTSSSTSSSGSSSAASSVSASVSNNNGNKNNNNMLLRADDAVSVGSSGNSSSKRRKRVPEDLRPTKAKHLRRGPIALAKTLVELFSKVERRSPPNGKSQHARLITITPSHFCEKGRWGLDLLENDPDSPIYVTEDSHPPGLSSLFTVPASQDQASQTPMVLLDRPDGTTDLLFKSSMLLKTMCPFLYPNEIPAQELERMELDLHQRLGATVRVYVYHVMLQEGYFEALIDVCTCQTSKIEQMIFGRLIHSGGFDEVIRRSLHCHEETAAWSEAEITRVFGDVSSRLSQNGGRYIMDDENKSYGFSVVDLTFAALACPLLRPPEMKPFQCPDDRIPPYALAFAARLKKTRAGKHAMRMYRDHRFGIRNQPTPPRGDVVRVKSGPSRNRVPWTELTLLFAAIVGLVAILMRLVVMVFFGRA